MTLRLTGVPDAAVRWASGAAMGTTVQLCLVGLDDPAAAMARVAALIDGVERELSRFRPDSDVSRLNAAPGTWVPVGRHLEPVASAAERYRALSEGAFDAITGATGVTAGAAGGPRLRFRDRGGIRQSRLEVGTRLDLGGIAKGYAADLARDSVPVGAGVLVSLGTSSVSVARTPPGRDGWRIGLRSPWQDVPEPLGYLTAAHGSFSLSGVNGCRVGAGTITPAHIVDPRTGLHPRTDLCTVGVLSDDGMRSEAWSTALLVLGLKHSLEVCARHGVEAVFLRTAGRVLATPGLADQVALREGVRPQ